MDKSTFERVTLDSSILLGARNKEFLAAADLGYYRGYWSSWIAAEFVRVRTEWIILRAAKDVVDRTEVARRLERSRARVNTEVNSWSQVLNLVDYLAGSDVDLSWLPDPDDHPIMQTAIAAGVPGVLVTDNKRDFPLGEERNGVLKLGSTKFLEALYRTQPEAEDAVADYLGIRQQL